MVPAPRRTVQQHEHAVQDCGHKHGSTTSLLLLLSTPLEVLLPLVLAALCSPLLHNRWAAWEQLGKQLPEPTAVHVAAAFSFTLLL
jgi:hypothetical protein